MLYIMPSLLKGAFRGLLPFFSRPLIRGGYSACCAPQPRQWLRTAGGGERRGRGCCRDWWGELWKKCAKCDAPSSPCRHRRTAVSPLLQDRGSSGGRAETGGGCPDAVAVAVAAVASATASAESALELARNEHTPSVDRGPRRTPPARPSRLVLGTTTSAGECPCLGRGLLRPAGFQISNQQKQKQSPA
jgi:hypothetical protein